VEIVQKKNVKNCKKKKNTRTFFPEKGRGGEKIALQHTKRPIVKGGGKMAIFLGEKKPPGRPNPSPKRKAHFKRKKKRLRQEEQV